MEKASDTKALAVALNSVQNAHSKCIYAYNNAKEGRVSTTRAWREMYRVLTELLLVFKTNAGAVSDDRKTTEEGKPIRSIDGTTSTSIRKPIHVATVPYNIINRDVKKYSTESVTDALRFVIPHCATEPMDNCVVIVEEHSPFGNDDFDNHINVSSVLNCLVMQGYIADDKKRVADILIRYVQDTESRVELIVYPREQYYPSTKVTEKQFSDTTIG